MARMTRTRTGLRGAPRPFVTTVCDVVESGSRPLARPAARRTLGRGGTYVLSMERKYSLAQPARTSGPTPTLDRASWPRSTLTRHAGHRPRHHAGGSDRRPSRARPHAVAPAGQPGHAT